MPDTTTGKRGCFLFLFLHLRCTLSCPSNRFFFFFLFQKTRSRFAIRDAPWKRASAVHFTYYSDDYVPPPHSDRARRRNVEKSRTCRHKETERPPRASERFFCTQGFRQTKRMYTAANGERKLIRSRRESSVKSKPRGRPTE